MLFNSLLRNLDELLTNSRCLDDLDDREKCNVDFMISALIEKLDEIKVCLCSSYNFHELNVMY
jgi:hypothetical protein